MLQGTGHHIHFFLKPFVETCLPSICLEIKTTKPYALLVICPHLVWNQGHYTFLADHSTRSQITVGNNRVDCTSDSAWLYKNP